MSCPSLAARLPSGEAMISGFEALQSIDNAYARARNDEMGLEHALRRAAEDAARLRQERLTQLHALAKLKFGLIKSGELIHDLDAAEHEAKALLDRIDREVDEAGRRRQEAFEALQQAQSTKNDRARAYDVTIGELRIFEEGVVSRLAGDSSLAALGARVEEIRGIFEEAEKKTAQAETDRQEKKTPYEQDPLFMYLWRRKYGTSEYRSGYFVRYFDELVARLIRYREARANYHMLNQIPDRLREHVERVRAQLQSQQTRLAELRQEKLLEAGAGPLQDKAAQAKAALDSAEAALLEARRRFEAADKSYGELIGRDHQGAFEQAIGAMAANDSRDEVVTLYREAARTKTDQDRVIVTKIDQLTLAIAKADGETAQLKQRIREAAARRAEIEQAQHDFHRRRYDYPGTTFGNEATINDVLGGILQGMVRGAVLGQVLQQGYQRPPMPDWGDGGDIGSIFPPSEPSFPPMGGGGDDDFSTGGSF